jgi:hypothetical protein
VLLLLPSILYCRWYYDGAATGLVAALSSIPHGKDDEAVAGGAARVTRGVDTIICGVDPTIMLRGVHHTHPAWTPWTSAAGTPSPTPARTDTITIPGAWIALALALVASPPACSV